MRLGWLLGLCATVACGASASPAPQREQARAEPSPEAYSGLGDAAADAPPFATPDSGACEGKAGPPGDFDRTMTIGGAERTYHLHVPPRYDASRAVPLVLVLHGFTETWDSVAETSHMMEVADQRGFVVALPQGLQNSWNAGACCGGAAASGVDDVGFVSTLIDVLSAQYCVDGKRVYSTGFSNGGFLSHRLACELSSKVAAIASVSGVMGVPTCAPSRPVPVLQIHGTSDPVVPYGGNPLLGFVSVDASMSGWASRDGCGSSKSEVLREGSAHCDRWTGCTGADVELCTVDGGVHEWPGGGSLWTDAGPPAGFVATHRIVDFFEAHPMP